MRFVLWAVFIQEMSWHQHETKPFHEPMHRSRKCPGTSMTPSHFMNQHHKLLQQIAASGIPNSRVRNVSSQVWKMLKKITLYYKWAEHTDKPFYIDSDTPCVWGAPNKYVGSQFRLHFVNSGQACRCIFFLVQTGIFCDIENIKT